MRTCLPSTDTKVRIYHLPANSEPDHLRASGWPVDPSVPDEIELTKTMARYVGVNHAQRNWQTKEYELMGI